MDGVHDLGGIHGFGAVPWTEAEPPFHAPWEGRVFALAGLAVAGGLANTDVFRHAIERLHPVTYLTAGYFGRWLGALETLVAETAAVALAPPSLPGTLRPTARPPRLAPGDRVRARTMSPAGHTRLPRYVRGHVGMIARVHPTFVLPDTNAAGRGEDPQTVYAVRFTATELWGADAEAGVSVHVDLFESYLEPAPA